MFEKWLVRFFVGCGRRPVLTLAVLGVMTLSSLGGLRWMRYADLFESFFAGASDEWGYYTELTKTFVTDQVIAVGLVPPSELYTRENLAVVRELSNELKALPGVESISDVTSVKYFQEGTDSFSSEPLVPDPLPQDPAAYARIKQRALAEPLFVGAFLSTDGQMAAIHVRVADDVTSEQRSTLVEALNRAVAKTTSAHPDWRVVITGGPYFTHFHEIYMQRDLATLTPLTMVLLLVVMVVVMRRIVGPLLALVGSAAFMAMATGLLVPMQASMNNTTTMVPAFAFVMGVTVILHFFTDFRLNYLRQRDRNAALNHTIEELTKPTYFANFSTSVGFLSLGISTIPAIRQFGFVMAVGMVLIVFVLMAYGAAVGRLVPPERLSKLEQHHDTSHMVSVRALTALGNHVVEHRVAWLLIIGLSSVLTLYGTTRIQIETNTLEMFHQRDRLYQDSIYYGDRFGGVSSLYLGIDGAKPGDVTQPAALRQFEQIEQFAARELEAGYTVSPAGYVKTMHRAFMGGDPAMRVVPDSAAAVSQLLLMNGDDTLRDVLNADASRAVLVAWVNEHSSQKLLKMKGRLLEYLATLPDVGVKYRVSGTLMLDTQLISDVSHSTLRSFVIAMLVIFLLRLVQFRHLGLGALSLLPNAFPIWTTFGFMGLVGIPLNVSTAMSATVTLGIADDETIHFFASYQARRRRGVAPRQAVLETLTDKGTSMMFSTLVVTIGFSTLLLSNYGPTMWFGLVLVISFIFSLFANLVFAPALLDLVRPVADPPAGAAPPNHHQP